MTGIVLSCEHASWTLPPDVDLGVPLRVLQSQAGWDHGAYEIASRIAEGLGITVHAGAFTRMLVDLNRAADHANVTPAVSYGAPVPGNAHLSRGDRAARIAQFHAPYWDAVRREVAARLAAGPEGDHGEVLHLASHSFSPELDAANRTYDVGVLYDPTHAYEAAVAERLLFHLRRADFDVRANQPYPGTGPSICTSLREELAGARYAGIQVETSHAITQRAGGCERVARALLRFLEDDDSSRASSAIT